MDDYLNDPTLVDPDAEGEIKYAWDEEFQRHVIALLLSDRQFLLQSLDLVKPSYFTNKSHQKAAQVAFKFFKQYRILPRKDFIAQEIKTDLKDNKALAYYLAELNVIYDYFQPGLDARDYLQDKITYFAKIQSVKKAFHDSLKTIEKNPESEETWDKVYDKMREAMTTHSNFDLGTNYFKSIKDRYEAMKEEDENDDRFLTGLVGIDQEISGGGYIKGELISVVAGSGVGKSIMLACITATNLLRGKKGVYITCELAERKVADRFDAIFTGFPIQCLFDHKEEIFDKLTTLEGVDYDATMPLVIKQFAAGQASVNTVRAYLSQLKFHGFDPDFVIVDYVGEMADYPDMKTYESREKTVRELRAMATEEDIFVATAMQPNRDSKNEAKNEHHRIDDQHLADSFGQIRPLDGCFSLNQNDAEKQLGIGRCYIIKQRDGKSRYQIYLRFDQENLKITEISRDTYRLALNAHKEAASDEIVVDHISNVVGNMNDHVENMVDKAKDGYIPSEEQEEKSED